MNVRPSSVGRLPLESGDVLRAVTPSTVSNSAGSQVRSTASQHSYSFTTMHTRSAFALGGQATTMHAPGTALQWLERGASSLNIASRLFVLGAESCDKCPTKSLAGSRLHRQSTSNRQFVLVPNVQSKTALHSFRTFNARRRSFRHFRPLGVRKGAMDPQARTSMRRTQYHRSMRCPLLCPLTLLVTIVHRNACQKA